MNVSLLTPRNHLADGRTVPENLCEVTEEYRVGSTFDILASIGGLLALFQGLHVFLFGRPLFWGLFGAKLITPFGFMGRFAREDFKQRLREHYHRSTDPEDTLESRVDIPREEENIYITRFLLDYVIDMGPASAIPQIDRRGDLRVSNTPERRNLLGIGQEDTELVELTRLSIHDPPDSRDLRGS
ncbi:hypothetical protein FRC11_006786 [Ceratobasidium sp. 423]|nr:hypothetical protein FRC11_006786 [Ceratobasidium sp. 423]